MIIHIDRPDCTRELVNHHDVLGALDDLEGIGHVHRPRDARQVAFDLRVELHPVGEVFLLFRQRLRFIRDGPAFDDPQPP